jgi:hypothetical protein
MIFPVWLYNFPSIYLDAPSPSIVSRNGDSGLRVFLNDQWQEFSTTSPSDQRQK